MRIDPKLLALLARQARASGKTVEQIIAEALRICPTCGQALPFTPVRRGRPPGAVNNQPTKRQRVVAFLAANPGANQADCARECGCSRAYVSQIMLEEKAATGG